MIDYIAFSGGVDSTALALLHPEAIPVFTDTGWEFDAIYHHLDRFEQVTGRAVIRVKSGEGSLPDYIERQRFMPSHGARFCTRIFKIEAYNRWLADKLPATLLIGLRADEPAEERVGNLSDIAGLTIRYPLREQGVNRITCVRICLENDLLPRREAYMARGGCKGCFYKRKSEVQAMVVLVPEVIDELQALEESVQDERGKFFRMFPNTGMSIAEIKQQPTLFDMEQIYRDAADTSDKGEACGLFCHR